MGADAVIVFYGIREIVPPDDEELLESLDSGTHPLLIAARSVGFDSWWGHFTDGSDYHVLIGKRLGVFGVENDCAASLNSDVLLNMIQDVRAALESTDIAGVPALHCQLEAQY